MALPRQLDAAQAYLLRDPTAHLMHLAALRYDEVLDVRARPDAVALVVAADPGVPGAGPTILGAADDAAALLRLVAEGGWPPAARWCVAHPDLRRALVAERGGACDLAQGECYYLAPPAVPPTPADPSQQRAVVRALTAHDAEALDLTPCRLSPAALRGWLRSGWRVYGAVVGDALLCHALAAYPVAGAEEIAGVFTAPRARRRGLAGAVVASVAADIAARGARAVYVAGRRNSASRRVAERLRFGLLFETWEIRLPA